MSTESFTTAWRREIRGDLLPLYIFIAVLATMLAMVTVVVVVEHGAQPATAYEVGRWVALVGAFALAWPILPPAATVAFRRWR